MNTRQAVVEREFEIPLVRLDKSKHYSSIHGERTPDDPMYHVHFWQGGLPFDATGILVPDVGPDKPFPGVVEGKSITFQPLYTPEMRGMVERRIARMLRSNQQAIEEAKLDTPPEPTVDPAEDVNFESFLRGEVNFPFESLQRAYFQRFHKRHQRVRHIIEDLIYEEKIVPEDQVHQKIMRMLDAPDAR